MDLTPPKASSMQTSLTNSTKLVVLSLVGGILVLGSQGAASLDRARLSTQATGSATQVAARITVTVPHDETELAVDGKTVPGTGTTREVEVPPLQPGVTYRFNFTAKWQPNTYTTITRSKTVSFRAGERLAVDLTVEDPDDRLRVQYVPTPADIVDEMIKLAEVGRQDVVYEPGCGDARITIAAVKAGARRGVGIDIDPERVAESRGRVKQAGLDGKIDIRLGDALDIRDLSAATVVFLYMGDHFNMLIRPILWKELKVGARVVSHRFTMGDWKPDKTVTVGSFDSLGYELHLWTVTEEIKRKASGLPKKIADALVLPR
jgi:uncharacterized protein (TIGR03000 family)